MQGHQPESLDWFNVLIAQTIAQLRDDARQDGAILTSLTEVLNAGSKPDWIGEIRVTEIALGDEFPIFSNCRIMPAEDGFAVGGGGSSGGGLGHEESRLQARMDVDLSDVITLGVETTLVLNYPKPRVAVLPVALAVSIIRFSGTLAVSFIPSSTPPSSTSTSSTTTHSPNTSEPPRPSTSSGAPPHRPTTLAFTFLDDYRLDLSVRSLVGSRSRLQDVPKIAQLIESRLHAWFDERAVEPRFQQIALPSLWPRKRNTRGGEEEEEGATSAIIDDDDEDTAATVGAADGQANSSTKSAGPAPAGASSSFIPSTSAATSLETRLEAEGAKLREAEIKAGERQRDGARDAATMAAQGMRWRGDGQQQRERSRLARNSPSGDWSGQRGMPGAMLSG